MNASFATCSTCFALAERKKNILLCVESVVERVHGSRESMKENICASIVQGENESAICSDTFSDWCDEFGFLLAFDWTSDLILANCSTLDGVRAHTKSAMLRGILG